MLTFAITMAILGGWGRKGHTYLNQYLHLFVYLNTFQYSAAILYPLRYRFSGGVNCCRILGSIEISGNIGTIWVQQKLSELVFYTFIGFLHNILGGITNT